MDLPVCHNCGNTVKPGQDECWTCLGETIPIDEVTYWVYGTDSSTLVSYPISMNTQPIVFQANNTISWTWPATTNASVTGLTYLVVGSTQTFQFSPINVVNGDTIQFTVNDILRVP